MDKRKFLILFFSVLFAGSAPATSLVYDNFESYGSTEDLQTVWHAFDEYNPAFVPVLNTTVAYEGGQCLELDSPVTSDWGIELGQQEDVIDVSSYDVMTAWVMSPEQSITWDVTFELRDVTGFGLIGYGEILYLSGDSQWYQISVPLDGEGDLTQLSQVLIWFDSDPTTEEEGIPQLYVDDIRFETVPEPATLMILGIGGLMLRRKK